MQKRDLYSAIFNYLFAFTAQITLVSYLLDFVSTRKYEFCSSFGILKKSKLS